LPDEWGADMTAFYAGWPCAMTAMLKLKEITEQ
jgi:hypothetical protein